MSGWGIGFLGKYLIFIRARGRGLRDRIRRYPTASSISLSLSLFWITKFSISNHLNGAIVYRSKRRKRKEREREEGGISKRKIGVKKSVGYYGNAVSGDKMASRGANETFFSDR